MFARSIRWERLIYGRCRIRSATAVWQVEVVDDDGNSLYSALVSKAHSGEGLLHRAFSIFLFSPDGSKILMQKRASTKTRWGLMWSNACCGHPCSRDTLLDDAQCRLEEELGIRVETCEEAGVLVFL